MGLVRSAHGFIFALLVFGFFVCAPSKYASAFYGEGAYYGQANYYAQGYYYGQGYYYAQSYYYAQGGYYAQGYYYAQSGYYAQGSYAPPDPPSCSITVATTPLAYGSNTTLTWYSWGATSMYISSVGYVTPNAQNSTTVAPLSTTVYTATASGSGGITTCSVTLTVGAPGGPTCTLDASASTINLGQSTTLTWTYQNGTSATLSEQ